MIMIMIIRRRRISTDVFGIITQTTDCRYDITLMQHSIPPTWRR